MKSNEYLQQNFFKHISNLKNYEVDLVINPCTVVVLKPIIYYCFCINSYIREIAENL